MTDVSSEAPILPPESISAIDEPVPVLEAPKTVAPKSIDSRVEALERLLSLVSPIAAAYYDTAPKE